MHCELDILLLVADIDECTDGTHICDSNAACDNDNGTYHCTCGTGYTGNGLTCEGE